MIDIITVSSKGQIVLPKTIREDIKLKEKDKLLVLSEDGKIILEKVSEEEARKGFSSLMDYFSHEFKKHGINKQDLEREIKAVRSKNA